uniref:F-box domain-containing protein n=1 Tax=Mycena chlorophos TaxID=658473 RepID=A0ABQ0M5B6_MYCCL|nr:predicted protein [Mycena chlorophos]
MSDASIQSLPPELIRHIFLSSKPHSGFRSSTRPRDVPILLTHVCSQWREIALSTSALWTGLDLDTSMLHLVEIIFAWSIRSGTLPLTLTLSGDLTDFFDTVTYFEEIMMLLAPRIEKLELFMSMIEDIDIFDEVQLTFPNLREVYFQPSLGLDPDEPEVDGNLFLRCRKLQKVSMAHMPADGVRLPWAQLTSFEHCGRRRESIIEDPLQILRLAPNLLHMSCAVHNQQREDTPTPLLHAKLEHLELNAEPADLHQQHFLAFFTLPSLKVLECSDSDGLTSEALDAFLERSSPPLETLLVHPYDIQSFSSIKPFQRLATLSRLDLRLISTSFASAFLEAFTSSSNPILPSLSNLTLGCRQNAFDRDDTPEADLPFLTARLPVAFLAKRRRTCLVHVLVVRLPLRGTLALDEQVVSAYAEMRKRGARVYVSTER